MQSLKAFVTGVTGFVGRHLASLLLREGVEVFGLGSMEHPLSAQLPMPPDVNVVKADICDADAVRCALQETKPDYVFHLAAISNIPVSIENPTRTYQVNVGGTLNLFEAICKLELRPRIVNVSTAHVYGSMKGDSGGISEDCAVHLLTPYATSKYMAEVLADHYMETYGLQIMTMRPFNHIGPGQGLGFICSDLARQIALIKRKQIPPVLRTGNLEPERDFTDVRDVVESYWAVAVKGVSGCRYNVCSGVPCRIGHIVNLLCELAEVEIEVQPDPAKLRSAELYRLWGNSSELRALGWQPHIPLKKTLGDILDFWMDATGTGRCGASSAIGPQS